MKSDYKNFRERVTARNPYNNRMYRDDYFLAQKVFQQCFGSLVSLHEHKEDLITICVNNLWEYRRKYYNHKKGKYAAGAYEVCRQTIWKNTIKDEQWKFENSLVALDMPIGTNESTLLDVVDNISVDQAEQESIDRTNVTFYESHNEIIGGFNSKAQEILLLFMGGYTEQEIAEKVGCCRQWVTRVKSNYKTAFVDKTLEIENEVKEIS